MFPLTRLKHGRSEAWWQEQRLGNARSRGGDGDGRRCAARLVSFRRHRFVRHRRHDETSQQAGRRISTYTVGIESEDLRYDIIPDDVNWARRVNEHLDTDYHEIMLQPAVAELLPKLVYHMDEPAIDMAIPSYLVSQAARETLTRDAVGNGR